MWFSVCMPFMYKIWTKYRFCVKQPFCPLKLQLYNIYSLLFHQTIRTQHPIYTIFKKEPKIWQLHHQTGMFLKCRNMPAFSARLWGNNRQFGGCSVSKRGYQIVTPYRMYVSVTVRLNGTDQVSIFTNPVKVQVYNHFSHPRHQAPIWHHDLWFL